MILYNNLIPKEDMIKWRRHIHENPENSFEEYETADYIEKVLKSFGHIEIKRPTPTSVVGLLKGSKKGKTIGLRADIDALPIEEETGKEYSSKNTGIMHACGHDTHTAMLLGTAKVLVELRENLAGNVKFIFQHAEETPPGGAIELVKKGVVKDVDMIFGQHITPGLAVGTIGTRLGSLFAASDVMELKILGRGSHASRPDASIDPILIGSEIVSSINNIVSRNINPFDSVVISFGQFTSGYTSNVIPDTAILKASIRTLDRNMRIYIKNRIEIIVDGICKIYGAKYELNYILGYPTVPNDKKCYEIVLNAAKKVGKHIIPDKAQGMGGEDFSYYLEEIPGCYFVIGGGTEKDGVKYSSHHPKYTINEDALPYGCSMYIQIVLDTIGNK